MKRTAVILGILGIAVWGAAAASGQGQKTPPANQPAAQGTGAQPAAKRPPQAKTQAEFDAYKAAVANTDPAALEKASDDFAAKYPDSELRLLLYKTAMRLYQNANNGEKTEAMGRKVLSLDPDDPEALTTVSEVVAERTRDSDLDKQQRFDEAVKMAEKATQTVDTDLNLPAGVPQEKIDAYKALLRSNAYSIIGTIDFKKEDYVAAREHLQKSIDAYPSSPDAVVILRLALTLDKLATAAADPDKPKLYEEALKNASRAVELTQENTPIGTPARRERDRLQQLTAAPAPAPTPTPKPQTENQPPQH